MNREDRRRHDNGGFPMRMNAKERLAAHRRTPQAVVNNGCILNALEADQLFHTIHSTFLTCTPEEVAETRAANPNSVIWKGRKHTKIPIYGKEGIPHRDVVAFATFNAEGHHAVYRFGDGSGRVAPVCQGHSNAVR